jgi:hypothetical protein
MIELVQVHDPPSKDRLNLHLHVVLATVWKGSIMAQAGNTLFDYYLVWWIAWSIADNSSRRSSMENVTTTIKASLC